MGSPACWESFPEGNESPVRHEVTNNIEPEVDDGHRAVDRQVLIANESGDPCSVGVSDGDVVRRLSDELGDRTAFENGGRDRSECWAIALSDQDQGDGGNADGDCDLEPEKHGVWCPRFRPGI